jgi:hypothetical protein
MLFHNAIQVATSTGIRFDRCESFMNPVCINPLGNDTRRFPDMMSENVLAPAPGAA